MAKALSVGVRELVGNAELCSHIQASDFVDDKFGLPTINDILNVLVMPGRDPRSEASKLNSPSFSRFNLINLTKIPL